MWYVACEVCVGTMFYSHTPLGKGKQQLAGADTCSQLDWSRWTLLGVPQVFLRRRKTSSSSRRPTAQVELMSCGLAVVAFSARAVKRSDGVPQLHCSRVCLALVYAELFLRCCT